jgi:2',3'-cyclic-nucleotide 2'-phosphodiesterase (5'-nucleotidase family)
MGTPRVQQEEKQAYVPIEQYIECDRSHMDPEEMAFHERAVSDFVKNAKGPVVTEFEIEKNRIHIPEGGDDAFGAMKKGGNKGNKPRGHGGHKPANGNRGDSKLAERFVNNGQNGADVKDASIINIIHTNDLHGNLDPNDGRGGMAYVAGKIKELRSENPNSLLVDAGDIAYAPPYSEKNRFNPMVVIMNEIGYDAMGTGNHEFQWEARKFGGPDGNPNPGLTDNLKELTEHAGFPVLCANVVRKGSDTAPGYLKPYVIQKVGDVNVGVVGVVTKKMATDAHPLVADGWQVMDQADTLNKVVPKMKQEGADVIVVISHDSLGRNGTMIGRTHGIDMVVGGHDHETTERPIAVRNADGDPVPLVEAGAHGYMVGRLQVSVDQESKKIKKITSVLYPVETHNTKADPEIEGIVNKWLRK